MGEAGRTMEIDALSGDAGKIANAKIKTPLSATE
jgi:hypothetical protein